MNDYEKKIKEFILEQIFLELEMYNKVKEKNKDFFILTSYVQNLLDIDNIFNIPDIVKKDKDIQNKIYEFVLIFLSSYSSDIDWLVDFLTNFPLKNNYLENEKLRRLLRKKMNFSNSEIDYYLEFFKFNNDDFRDPHIHEEILELIYSMQNEPCDCYYYDDYLYIFENYPVVGKGNKELDKLFNRYKKESFDLQ